MTDDILRGTTARLRRGWGNRRLRRHLRLLVSTRPSLYASYARIEKLPFTLSDRTRIVVDSYPRSGNSFFEAAFDRAHGGRIEVAHHSHAAAQVLRAVQRGLPCIVLLRDPEAAIASFYDMNGGIYPISLCTREYIAFYQALLPVIDRLIVVTTETMEERFHDLMAHLRDDLGLPVDPYVVDAEARRDLFARVDATGRARNGFSAERYSDSLGEAEKAARKATLAAIRAEVAAPANARRLQRAVALHAVFAARAFGRK